MTDIDLHPSRCLKRNKIMPRKTVLFSIFLVCIQLNAQIPRGTVKEGLICKSKILDQKVRYTIYLPFDYETSDRFYPVVYLLHGYTDNDMAWIQFGEAHLIADGAIANREIAPMILVTPDAGVSWYINNYNGTVRFEDFFILEFIPFIESKYRIRTERQYRAVSGLSMGGYGSLIYAFRHPELFSACAAFSAGIHTEDEYVQMEDKDWDKKYGPLYGPDLKGEERITTHLKMYNPIQIMQQADPDPIKRVRLYLDCGDDDSLSKGNSILHRVLKDLKIPHEYRVRDGGHTWEYWRSGLKDGLKFISTGFHQP